MQLQRERRHDPYPWTWEIPTAITVCLVVALVLGVQLGRSVANLAVGGGWTWPQHSTQDGSQGGSQGGSQDDGAVAPTPGSGRPVSDLSGPGGPPTPIDASLWTSIPAILGGDAAAGLPAAQSSEPATVRGSSRARSRTSAGPPAATGPATRPSPNQPATPAPNPVAGPVALWISLALTEATLVGGLLWAVALGYRRWGPGRMRGMASREQAQALLGLSRLRKVAPIVRPDLHPKRHRAAPDPDHPTNDPTGHPAGRLGQHPDQNSGHLENHRSYR